MTTDNLYANICNIKNLLSAWSKVKEKGSAGGIDRVTIKAFETDLDKNLRDLSEGFLS